MDNEKEIINQSDQENGSETITSDQENGSETITSDQENGSETTENHELKQLEIMNEKLDQYIKADSERNDQLLQTIEEIITSINEEKGNNEKILTAMVESNATPEDVQAVSYYSDLMTIVIFGAVVPIALAYKLGNMVIMPFVRHLI